MHAAGARNEQVTLVHCSPERAAYLRLTTARYVVSATLGCAHATLLSCRPHPRGATPATRRDQRAGPGAGACRPAGRRVCLVFAQCGRRRCAGAGRSRAHACLWRRLRDGRRSGACALGAGRAAGRCGSTLSAGDPGCGRAAAGPGRHCTGSTAVGSRCRLPASATRHRHPARACGASGAATALRRLAGTCGGRRRCRVGRTVGRAPAACRPSPMPLHSSCSSCSPWA